MSLSTAEDFLPGQGFSLSFSDRSRGREKERDRVRAEEDRRRRGDSEAGSDLRGVVVKLRKRDGHRIHQVCVST